ncbi:MAG: stage III sporulation protein AF [Otoolea sp.]|nr:stage III sporulation protein AF [Clostridium sp.]
MEAVYQWAGRIVSYLVFLSVLNGLLPAARYEKYLRLFAGCILILLVFQPLTGGLRLEESIRHLFDHISFENEAKELSDSLDEMEKKRLTMFLAQYKSQTEAEIRQLAEASGIAVTKAEVLVETDENSPEFARIREISLECQLPLQTTSKEEKESGGTISVDTVTGVALPPVLVGRKTQAAGVSPSDQRIAERLRQQLASYYQVEEAHVEIRLEAGEKPVTGKGEMDSSSG